MQRKAEGLGRLRKNAEELFEAVGKDKRRFKASPVPIDYNLIGLVIILLGLGTSALTIVTLATMSNIFVRQPLAETRMIEEKVKEIIIVKFQGRGIEAPAGWAIVDESYDSVEFRKNRSVIYINHITSTDIMQEMTLKTVSALKRLQSGNIHWEQPSFEQIRTNKWVYFEGIPDNGNFCRAYLLQSSNHYIQIIGVWHPAENTEGREEIRYLAQNSQ